MTSIISLELTQQLGAENVTISPTLIKTDSSVILFDACLPNQVDQLEDVLNNVGYSVMDITHLIISHQDHDHIGSLAAIKRMNRKVIVMTSEIEEPYISGKKESLRIIQAREFNKSLSGEQLQWGESFLNYLRAISPCEIDRTVSAKSEHFNTDITILHTPGHTPGHISLFIHSTKSFIAGDSMAIEHGELTIANPQFTLDMDLCKQTIKEIRTLNPTHIYCYHGGMIDNRNNEKMNDFLLRIEG